MAFFDNIKLFRRNSIFVRLILLLNVLSLLCLVALGVTVYSVSKRNTINIVTKANLLLATQARQEIERELTNLERLTMQLALENNLKTALSNSLPTARSRYSNLQAIRAISNTRSTHGQVRDLWVWLNKTDVVLSDSGQYDKSFFFSKVMPYQTEVTLETVYQNFPKLTYLGSQTLPAGEGERRVLAFGRAVPTDAFYPTGMIGIHLETSRFETLLNSLNEELLSFFYILGEDGSPIVQDNTMHALRPPQEVTQNLWEEIRQNGSSEGHQIEKIGTESYLITYSVSAQNNWSYFAVTPMRMINDSVSVVKFATILTIVLAFGVSLLISYLMAQRLYRPISQVVSLLRSLSLAPEHFSAQDEMQFIGTIVDNTYQKNEYLTALYQTNLPTLQEELLTGILNGKIAGEELKTRMEELAIVFPYPEHMVVTLVTDTEGTRSLLRREWSTIHQDMKEVAARTIDGRFVFHIISREADTFYCIFNVQTEESALQLVRETILAIQQLLNTTHGVLVSAGIGSLYPTPEGLRESFIESVGAVKYRTIRGHGSLIYIDEVKEMTDRTMLYSVATEMQLINQIKSHNLLAQEALVEDVLGEIDSLTPALAQHAMNTLVGTAIRTIYEIRSTVVAIFPQTPDLYQALNDMTGMDEKRKMLLHIFSTIGLFLKETQDSQVRLLKAQIDTIISRHGGNTTLAQIAEEVGFSYNYLSGMFKEITGEGFVEYQNAYRVARAKKLLCASDDTIRSIAEQAGFLSASSFIKVFRKHTGITPGTYRKTAK